MRKLTYPIINAQDMSASIDSGIMDINQIFKGSAQVDVAGTGTVSGTVQLQVSNDVCNYDPILRPFVPTNWNNLGSAVTISAINSQMIAAFDLNYRWLRAVFTDTLAVESTVTAIAAGVLQVDQAVAIADVGALEVDDVSVTGVVSGIAQDGELTVPNTAGATQGDYVVFTNAVTGETYAFWLKIDGNTTEPTGAAYVAATHKYPIAITTGGTADDTAAAIETAFDAAHMSDGFLWIYTDDTGGDIFMTSERYAAGVDPTPHNANDSGAGSISYAQNTPGSNNSLVDGVYFLLETISDSTEYYVWFSAYGSNVDPAIGGKTGIEVDLGSGSIDDNGVATALRAQLTTTLGANATITGATSHCIITQAIMGPATVEDGVVATGFTFTQTTLGVLSNLNDTYFTFSVIDDDDYYVWMNVNSEGTDPTVPSRTGIEVTLSPGDSANTVGGAIRSAVTAAVAATATISGSNATAIITQVIVGPITHIADGAAPTGFTLTTPTPGIDNELNSTYFTLQNGAGTFFYVWMDVDGGGVDPMVPGMTGVSVAINSTDTANQVATALRAATITDVTITGSSAQAIYTNDDPGSAQGAEDSEAAPTGFTFSADDGSNAQLTVSVFLHGF